jgi:hypothetical protein
MKSHLNVVLFSIGHSSRNNYVVTWFFPPQRSSRSEESNDFFFGIRLRWVPNSPLLKKRTLLEKRKIGWHMILLTTRVKEKKGSTLNYKDHLVATRQGYFFLFGDHLMATKWFFFFLESPRL